MFLVPLGVFGALLCVLYHRTGSLLPCMVLHALNNSLALGVSQSWEPLQVIALMLGAAVAVLALVLPFARRAGASDRPEPPRRRGRSSTARIPPARVRGAHPVGAVALAQDPLGLLERAVARRARAARRGAADRLRGEARAAGASPRPSAASPSSPSRPARNELSTISAPGDGRVGAAVEQRERERRARAPPGPRRSRAAACASIARSSTVPSRGCGRMSHHRNV